jgi:predicted N-acetyltransferase YhbS
MRQELGDGLVLRAVESDADIERLALFNGRIHGDEEAVLTRRLLSHHPHAQRRHWLFVEQGEGGPILSTLCLIPWELRFDDVPLRGAEMGFVGTDSAHRRGGLVRRLVAAFDRLLAAEGFDLTHIQGIPYFYRQFGYSYAVPLVPDFRVPLAPLRGLPAVPGLRFRPAEPADIPRLDALFRAANRFDGTGLTSVRSEPVWRYLLSGATAGEGETWCVERGGEGVVGTFRTHRRGFGPGLIVSEVSPLSRSYGLALLAELGRRAEAADKPWVKLELDPEAEIVALAGSLGGAAASAYAWQIRFPDVPALLRRISPALERRIAAGPHRVLPTRLIISLYREAVGLVWRDGVLAAVERIDPPPQAPVCIPPDAFVPLVLGYRSLGELAACYHDIRVEQALRPLVEALFPKRRSFLYGIY